MILARGYGLEPVDGLPVNCLGNGQVSHTLAARRTVPMFCARSRMDRDALADADDGAAFLLNPAAAFGHVENLSRGMGVPVGPCSRLEGHQRSTGLTGRNHLGHRPDAHRPREIGGRSRLGGRFASANDRLSLGSGSRAAEQGDNVKTFHDLISSSVNGGIVRR